jgi:hypothetical protein
MTGSEVGFPIEDGFERLEAQLSFDKTFDEEKSQRQIGFLHGYQKARDDVQAEPIGALDYLKNNMGFKLVPINNSEGRDGYAFGYTIDAEGKGRGRYMAMVIPGLREVHKIDVMEVYTKKGPDWQKVSDQHDLMLFEVVGMIINKPTQFF